MTKEDLKNLILEVYEEEMAEDFRQISKTDINILKEMSLNAQEYFEVYIREYFKDPTKMFLNWLNTL